MINKCYKCGKLAKYLIEMNYNPNVVEYVCEEHLTEVDIFNELAKKANMERQQLMSDKEIEFLRWTRENNYSLNGKKIYYDSRYGHLYLGDIHYFDDINEYGFIVDPKLEDKDCYDIRLLAVTLLEFYIKNKKSES